MSRPTLTRQQQQLQQQRQMQQDLPADHGRDVPPRQDQAPPRTATAKQQNANADQ